MNISAKYDDDELPKKLKKNSAHTTRIRNPTTSQFGNVIVLSYSKPYPYGAKDPLRCLTNASLSSESPFPCKPIFPTFALYDGPVALHT